MSIRNNISKKVNPFKHQSHRFNFPPFPKSLPLPFSVWNLGAHGTQGNQAINKSPNHPCLEVPWLPPSKQPSSFSKNLPWSLLVVGNAIIAISKNRWKRHQGVSWTGTFASLVSFFSVIHGPSGHLVVVTTVTYQVKEVCGVSKGTVFAEKFPAKRSACHEATMDRMYPSYGLYVHNTSQPAA